MQPTRRSTPVPSPRILKYVLTWLSLALILAIGFGSQSGFEAVSATVKSHLQETPAHLLKDAGSRPQPVSPPPALRLDSPLGSLRVVPVAVLRNQKSL